jgi:hypothetical protein
VAGVGYSLSLTRGFFAVVLMSLAGSVGSHLLRPFIGDWCHLAEIGISSLVGMLILQLTFWRSLIAVIVYSVVFVAATVGVGLCFRAA